MDEFLDNFVSTTITNAKHNREQAETDYANSIEAAADLQKGVDRAKADYPAAVERANADYAAAVKIFAQGGDGADALNVATASREKAAAIKAASEIIITPNIKSAPKPASAFAPIVLANPLVARAYPKLGGYDVTPDTQERELAVSVVDEDGVVLARYTGVRG